MALRVWILLMFGFVMIYPDSSAKFCMRRYVNGKWVTTGDCGGVKRTSQMQKELIELKAKDENKWTVFQRRINGDVDFNRNWTDYVKGFGNPAGDYWLGLEELHEKTKEGNMEMEIHMIESTGIHWMVKYSNFQIGPSSEKYILTGSGYSGNTSHDFFMPHRNRKFSTKDADNDIFENSDCASDWGGGWWYGWGHSCGDTNLNGKFESSDQKGFWWWRPSRGRYSLSYSEMKIRRRS